MSLLSPSPQPLSPREREKWGRPEHLPIKQERLGRILKDFKRILVCFSGGIDSTFLLWSAQEAVGSDNALAVTASSASLAKGEQEEIEKIIAKLQCQHQWIKTDEFDNPNYIGNSDNRCFFCKDALFSKTAAMATQGNWIVVDGFNYSDRDDIRPGYQAATKWKVRHPLEEAGLTKSEIRLLAHEAKLPNWDKPATPCLSSRIPHGQPVTLQALSKVEQAEEFIKSFSAVIVRVRHLSDDTAKIEVGPQDFSKIRNRFEEIRQRFASLGFKNTYLDLKPKITL